MLQRLHPLQNEVFRLRESSPKIVQRIYLLQLFLSGLGLTLRSQRSAETVVRLLEVRLQCNGLLKRSNRSRGIARRVQLHAQVIL